MVIYSIDKVEAVFRVYAIKRNIFIYEEYLPFPQKTEIAGDEGKHKTNAFTDIPNLTEQSRLSIGSRRSITEKLRCGIPYSVTPELIREANRWMAEFSYDFDSSTVSEFLSRTLKTIKNRIFEGDLPRIST